jgi:hypothetical protein
LELVMSLGAQAEEQPQPAVPSFQVRTARELFEALESPDGGIRLAALQAIQQAPSTALSFGLHGKRDLLDVLLTQAERWRGEFEWMNWIGAIAGFRDPRVFRLFTSLITTETHSELLFALANYLQTEDLASVRIPLGEALLQNTCAARARTVAPLLSWGTDLSPAEVLRIRLLEPGASPIPMFSAASEEWVEELAGPFQSEARQELRRQGPSTLAALVGYWERLGDSSKKWLLEWATEADADLVLEPIREVLTKRADGLVLAALEAAANVKDFPVALEGAIVPLLEHRDELIRRGAVLASRSGRDWPRLFENEPSTLVKQACIAKIMEQEGQEGMPFALQQLASPDWRIRAAAAEGLLSLGPSGVRAALTLLPEAGESVRIGIARMVAHAADEELLNEFMQSCPPPVTTQRGNPISQPNTQTESS